MDDSEVVQSGFKTEVNESSTAVNESSTAVTIETCPIRISDGIQISGEGIVDDLGEDDGCSTSAVEGPGCKSCKKSDCDFKADGPNNRKVDQGYPPLHEKLGKALTNMKVWLAGCSAAEGVIQSQLKDVKASDCEILLFRRVKSLAASLSSCSIDLLVEHSTHDALRVEVVSSLLYSILLLVLQGNLTCIGGIERLESLTKDKDYFSQEVAAYGYAGITLTTIGSLQMETTKLIKNGNRVLRILNQSLPASFLLSHDDTRMWYCSHCVIVGDCCFQLKEYDGSMPWYEAALRVAKLDLTCPKIVSPANPDSNIAESSTAGTQHYVWKIKAADIHSHIGRMYHNVDKYEEAAKHWYDAAELHPERTEGEGAQAKGDKALTSLFYSGDAVKALDATKQLLLQTSNLDSNLRRAELLAFKGRIEAFKGDFDDSILSLAEAKRYYEGKGSLEAPTLVIINLYLVLVYSRKHDYRAALGIVENFEVIMDLHHKHTMWWFLWKAHKAHIYVDLGQFETATVILDQVEVPEDKNWKRLEAFVASVKAKLYLYENPREIDCVQDQYDIIEESSSEVEVRGSHARRTVEGVANMRAIYLNIDNWDMGYLERTYDMCQERVDLLRNRAGEEIELARALLRQAVALGKRWMFTQKWNHQGTSEVNELIDEAIQLVATRDHRFLAILKFAKTVFVQDIDPSSTGEAEGHDAAFIFAELQLKLEDLESAWISMLELEMMHVFNFMQYTSLILYKTPMKALLWAERGRMRLFMHLAKEGGNTALLNVEKTSLESGAQQAVSHVLEHGQKPDELHGPREQVSPSIESLGKQQCNVPTNQNPSEGMTQQAVEGIHENTGPAKKLSGSDELWFDRNDVLAEKQLFDAVAQCDPRALILEYTVWEQMQDTYIIYAVCIGPEGQHTVDHQIPSIRDFYSEYRKADIKEWHWGETLKDLIYKTREFISTKKDKLALEGLTMLNHLLIEPVKHCVEKFPRLILAVHDDLALVPFAALYNRQRRKFLVQEKILSYIPSIRVLHYCFQRQKVFEQSMQKKLLGPPFIAGNPGSLPGWGKESLENASEEATFVARMLGVRPHIGLDMNKNAVKNGLSKGSIVLLATHGLVDAFYPHGALILQDRNASSSDLNGSSLTTLNKDGDATISADEIATLPGGIRAGLVVLSACETGKGKVTQEGLLGLGRSLLQGGAPSAILTLWEVGDLSNKVLVEGLFEQLVEKSKDVAESLQLTMQQMIKDREKKYSICHWAPLFVLGSPSLKYNHTTHFTE